MRSVATHVFLTLNNIKIVSNSQVQGKLIYIIKLYILLRFTNCQKCHTSFSNSNNF
jgi:hypothetical protein